MIRLWPSFILKVLLNLDKANVWMLRHGKIAVDETQEDHAGIKEECAVEPKPVYELREEFWQRGDAEERGEQDEGCPGAAKLCWEHLADDNLQKCIVGVFGDESEYLYDWVESHLGSSINHQNKHKRSPAEFSNVISILGMWLQMRYKYKMISLLDASFTWK